MISEQQIGPGQIPTSTQYMENSVKILDCLKLRVFVQWKGRAREIPASNATDRVDPVQAHRIPPFGCIGSRCGMPR